MKILEARYSLAETAALAGMSAGALYKSIARQTLTLARKNGGQFSFTFNDVVGICAFAELLRTGISAPAADKASCIVSDDELAAHLLVRKRVEIWLVITRTAERDDVVVAWGADKLRDALSAAASNVTVLVRLHSLVADVAEAIDAMRSERSR